VLYNYFDYKQRHVQTETKVVARLLKQLVSHVATIPSELQRAYDDPKIRSGLSSNFQKLVQLFTSISSGFQKVFIILDGLDECEEIIRERIIELIEMLCNRLSLRGLVTCRPHVQVEKIPQTAKNVLWIQANDEDIKNHIRRRLSRERNVYPKLEDMIVGKLSGMAQGM
jgi:hypothetical protein